MTKSIVRFSFPGNIVWYPDIKDRWSKILVEYIVSELEIGNGIFLNIAPCIAKDITDFKDTYLTDHIVVEIICDMPQAIIKDEFAIRAKLITLLEDRTFDFIKFHNCGPGRDTSMVVNKVPKTV